MYIEILGMCLSKTYLETKKDLYLLFLKQIYLMKNSLNKKIGSYKYE